MPNRSFYVFNCTWLPSDETAVNISLYALYRIWYPCNHRIDRQTGQKEAGRHECFILQLGLCFRHRKMSNVITMQLISHYHKILANTGFLQSNKMSPDLPVGGLPINRL